ncbi:4779_t:CDS:2, partial [Dentiscutata heterogama]
KRRSPFGMELRERKKQVHYDENQDPDFSDSSDYLEPKRLPLNLITDFSTIFDSDEIEDEPALEQKLSDSPEETTNRSNNELDAYVNETIRDGNKWIVCDTDVRDLLIKWKQEKPRPRTDLAFYDIIDITLGSNSDFVQSLPIDAVQDMKQSKMFPTPNMDNVDEMKNYIIDFIK